MNRSTLMDRKYTRLDDVRNVIDPMIKEST